jgi:hypothetical protein
MNLFGSKAPSRPSTESVIVALQAALRMIDDESADAPLPVQQERVCRAVLALKETVMHATEDLGESAEHSDKWNEATAAIQEVATGLMRFEVMPGILTKMSRVDFETRQAVRCDWTYACNELYRRQYRKYTKPERHGKPSVRWVMGVTLVNSRCNSRFPGVAVPYLFFS